MQPYFFPYLGYFQLIHSVDTFVVYDDVNFIKGGWINRNFILSRDEPSRITLQLVGASPNVWINQVSVGGNRAKLLKTIRQSYAGAPQFEAAMPVIEELLLQDIPNLALYLDGILRGVSRYLGMSPTWLMSSELEKDNQLRGQDKVLAICRELGATQYVNLPGGRNLYDHDAFRQDGIQLSFLEPSPADYPQFGKAFVPNLSIIDVLMFNDKPRLASRVTEYALA